MNLSRRGLLRGLASLALLGPLSLRKSLAMLAPAPVVAPEFPDGFYNHILQEMYLPSIVDTLKAENVLWREVSRTTRKGA